MERSSMSTNLTNKPLPTSVKYRGPQSFFFFRFRVCVCWTKTNTFYNIAQQNPKTTPLHPVGEVEKHRRLAMSGPAGDEAGASGNRECFFRDNASRQTVDSRLQANAPEFHPSDTSIGEKNQGAIRKNNNNSNRNGYNGRSRNHNGRFYKEYRNGGKSGEDLADQGEVKPKHRNNSQRKKNNEYWDKSQSEHGNDRTYKKSFKQNNNRRQQNQSEDGAETQSFFTKSRQKSTTENSSQSSFKSEHKTQLNNDFPEESGSGSYKSNNKKYDDNKYYTKSNYKNGYYNNSVSKYDGDFCKRRNNYHHADSNWRSNEPVQTKSPGKKKLDAASQRDRLSHMLLHRTLECLVCCEKLRPTDKVWSCKQCYHILHLNCITKWAKSSKLEEGWRCPACQNVKIEVPTEYRCYCDKYAEPKSEPGAVPHSCGEVCARKRKNCDHACTLLCHPGPCPDCQVMTGKKCGCGRTSMTVKCCSEQEILCGEKCEKMLNCTQHKCERICHVGACGDCAQIKTISCYCSGTIKEVVCAEDNVDVVFYECGETCGKTLSCGNHKCEKKCHAGDCDRCELDPAIVKFCPCGMTRLEVERKSCLDPVPCCDKVCNKKLACGQPSEPHLCAEKCHLGACPPCPQTTLVRCRCGHMDRELACRELTTKADDARCQKKCTKKRTCGKHKCNQYCCIDVDHICPLPCNRLLSCGLHRCEHPCHRGNCPACYRASFEELYCECGASVLFPPVPCGTKPPACDRICSRVRSCGHEQLHKCHTGQCPPCSIFTDRWCHGEHEMRGTIPCYQEDFSCGLPCGKPMSCTRHNCVQICHKGACPVPCTQPCTKPRPTCEHACNQPCHDGECPVTACRQQVTVSCQCGQRTSTRVCADVASDYQKIAMSQLASKMADIQRGVSVDISDIVNKRGGTHKTLECTEECRIYERNRRLAIGLQIRNPDLSQKLTPRYSEFIRGWAKKNPRFVQNVHDRLTELVKLAKDSKQKSRSYSFDCMNKDKRHVVHEYCEHFGCDSAAYDKEPNRNVVATAFKDKSWLPSMSVLEVLQRENGQRKVPVPVMNKPAAAGVLRPTTTTSLRSLPRPQRPSTPPGETYDYFDNPP